MGHGSAEVWGMGQLKHAAWVGGAGGRRRRDVGMDDVLVDDGGVSISDDIVETAPAPRYCTAEDRPASLGCPGQMIDDQMYAVFVPLIFQANLSCGAGCG